MPHIVIEYSSNLGRVVEFGRVLKAVHQAAAESGCFVPSAVRTRAVECTQYLIGDAHPDNAFVHAVLSLRPGRSEADLRSVGAAVFDALTSELESAYSGGPLGITFEMRVIDTANRYLRCNLEQHHRQRAEAPAGTSTL